MQVVLTPPPLTTARFRFHGNLKRFLDPQRQGRIFTHTVKGKPSIKDTLEALGVPHTEIDCIFVNGKAVDFSYQMQGHEKITIYPPGYSLGKKGKRLCAKPSGSARFVVDSHLGRLVRHLRLLGFDSLYKKIFPDQEIAHIGVLENRIVLTRDIGLLKNRIIKYGCFLYSTDPFHQIRQVMNRYRLYAQVRPFSLCLECNGRIKPVAKRGIGEQLPPKVKRYYNRFYLCSKCKKIYWKGSHYDKMVKFIERFRKKKVCI